MMLLRLSPFALAVFCVCIGTPAQQPAPLPTPDAIMARVAANQDRSEAARRHFVYIQHVRSSSRKGHTIRCEEITDTRVTPTPTGSERHLLSLQGRLLQKGSYITYTNLLPKEENNARQGKDSDDLHLTLGDDNDPMDRDLVENMRDNLLNEHSKDGIASNLFPLTTKEQKDYDFRLLGREHMNGRDVFHLEFAPKDKSDFSWKGDAYIDCEAFEPVVIRTTLSRHVPLAVRALLGTNVPGLGFTVIYAPQPTLAQSDPVWFPVSFGTEFKLHVLFFLRRNIVISAENRDFEKTHVHSTILGSAVPPALP
jgi:hypothetical protein